MLTCDPLGSPYVGVTCNRVGDNASVILRSTEAIVESPPTIGGSVEHMRTAARRAARRVGADLHSIALCCTYRVDSVRVASVAKQARRMVTGFGSCGTVERAAAE